MSEKKGLLVICDRCGAQEFRETIGDGEADGGYTRWNKFEEGTPGWDTVKDYDVHLRLCPVCMAAYKNVVSRFMERVE